MILIQTILEGVYILQPIVHKDSRGYFFESYNQQNFNKLGISAEFVQDNEAKSVYGVVRGLHFQVGEFAQAKLVRVTQGKVLDVIVDLRKGSKTFGMHIEVILSSLNQKQIFIPKGLAHGYSVLSKTAVFNYKCDHYYSAINESGIHPLDPTLNIDWKIDRSEMILSNKDLSWSKFIK